MNIDNFIYHGINSADVNKKETLMLATILTKIILMVTKADHELAITLVFNAKLPAHLQKEIAALIIRDSLMTHAAICMISLSERFSGDRAHCFHKELLAWALRSGSLRNARLYAAHLGRELTKEEAQHILETDVHRNTIMDTDVPIFTSLGVIPANPSTIEQSVKKNLECGLKNQTLRVLERVGLTLNDFNISPQEMHIYECAAVVNSRH